MVAFMAEIIAEPLDNRNAALPYLRRAHYCEVLAVFAHNDKQGSKQIPCYTAEISLMIILYQIENAFIHCRISSRETAEKDFHLRRAR